MCIINTCPCQSFGEAIAEKRERERERERERKNILANASPQRKGELSYLSKWLIFCRIPVEQGK